MTIRCHAMTTWRKTDGNRKYHVLILGYLTYFKNLKKKWVNIILVLHVSKKEYEEYLEMPQKTCPRDGTLIFLELPPKFEDHTTGESQRTTFVSP